jgi:hypothetical protein
VNKLVVTGSAAHPRPALLVEAALDADDPFTAPSDLVWTAFSRVRGISARRGRQYQLDTTQPGTASLTLFNEASAYDPGNTSGPFAPGLDVNIPIRARLIHDGVIDGVFAGFTDSFDSSWTAGRPEMTLGCVDALAQMAGEELAASWASYLTDELGAYSWLRLGENAEDFANTGTGSGTGTVNALSHILRFSGPTLVDVDVDGLVRSADGAVTLIAPTVLAPQVGVMIGNEINPGQAWGVSGLGGPGGSAQSTAVLLYRINSQPVDGTHAWVTVGAPGPAPIDPANGADVLTTGASFYPSLRVDFHSTGNIYTLVAKDGAGLHQVSATVGPTAGQVDMLALTLETAGHWTLYVNGDTTPAAALPSLSLVGHGAERLLLGLTGTTRGPFSHTLDEFAIFSALTPAQIADLYAQWKISLDLPAQLTGDRVNALLDWFGWPTELRSIDPGTVQLAAIPSPAGTQLADQMQAAANAELGTTFTDGHGRICFRDADRNTGQPVLATFGENPGEYHYEGDVRIVRDRTRQFNVWQITQDGGSTATASDTDAKLRKNGKRVGSRTVPFASPADAAAQATTLLTQTKDAHDRIDQVTLKAEANDANLDHVAARELTDLVVVTRRTPGGSTTSIPSVVEGVAVTVTVDTNSAAIAATFQLDPYPGTPA